MNQVTGIGGVFLKARDPKALQVWYQEKLGVPVEEDGTTVFWWRRIDSFFKFGSTVWSAMPHDTDYFGPKTDQQAMVNFRVDDLDAMREQLRAAGVEVIDATEEQEWGRFGWCVDPEGNRIELWQPPQAEITLKRSAPVERVPVTVDHNAMVSLREMNKENAWTVMTLKVAPEQENFVANNLVSIAQAHFEPLAWYRAIYADETPVGFAMLKIDTVEADYYLWRFMVDQRYQGFGFGKRALQQIIDYVRTLPGATKLSVSCVPGHGSPCPFYEKMGFTYTGEEDEGELVLTLAL